VFTYVIIYIVLYLLTLLTIFYYFVTNFPNTNCTNWSFIELLSISSTYFPNNWALKFLILQLSGLPPFFFFVLKFNFLVVASYYVNFFILVLLFINMLLGMFFYLKIFSIQGDHISNENLRKICENRPISKVSKAKHTNREYWFWLFFCLYIFLNIFSVLFFADLFIIGSYFTA
jgi:NADH:ubiquinone oxidoreductase subunit 2 (subunit N)